MTTTYTVTFEVDEELLLTDVNGEEVDGVSALILLLRERLYKNGKDGSVTGWICDMTKVTSVTLPDLGKVWALYQEMIDTDVLEDRREYSDEDLVQAYGTSPEETKYLMRLILSEFAPCTAALYRSHWNFRDAQGLGRCVTESIHQGFDGWEDSEKVLIQLYLHDLGTALRSEISADRT